jgi:hypothetical protein
MPAEPPKKTTIPVPADKFVIYAGEDDLALRTEPSPGGFLWKRMVLGTELTCLEPKAAAKAKIGVQGQWIQVQESAGNQGYVAAWYVSEQKGKPATPPPAATTAPAPVAAPKPGSAPAPKPAAPLPPGALAFVPTEELSFRTQPVISPETLIRRVPVTEQLVCIEPANQAIPKVGVTNQWLKMRDASNKEGYVAAWYVKYASGSTAQAQAVSTPASTGGPVKIKAVCEAVALRNQPVVSDASLIKRVPINWEFTITEPGGEAKVGANNQWIKVKDSTNEGFVAAWFVGR